MNIIKHEIRYQYLRLRNKWYMYRWQLNNKSLHYYGNYTIDRGAPFYADSAYAAPKAPEGSYIIGAND